MNATFQSAVNSIEIPVSERIANALRRTFPEAHAVKLIARRANKDVRAVRAWLDQECVPSGTSFIDLMAISEELQNEVNLMIAERRALCGK